MNFGFTLWKGYCCVALAAIFLIACDSSSSQRKQGTHHDLKQYFEGETALIRQSGLRLSKRVALNGQTDSTKKPARDTALLQNLLKPFIDADINKPSLQDAYDTVATTNQFTGRSTVVYTARKRSVNPQQVTLNIDKQGKITNALIYKHTHNLVYEYRQTLLYDHLKNIQINTYQKIAFLQPRELDIRVLLEHEN